MKKVTIYGSLGLLGEALVRQYRGAGWQVRCCTRAVVDLTDSEVLLKDLSENPADLVLNASGMTGLEACLDFPDEARRVNATAPAEIARFCASNNMRFVHFSTDYVFDACGPGYIDESAAVNPANIYGKSKLDGEREVLENHPSALVCRVSWVFGHGRKSFVDQVVEHALAGKAQAYIADKWSVPNFADDLVEMCFQLVERNAEGVVHLCSSGGEATWHSYAETVVETMVQLGMIESGAGLLRESKLDEVTAFRAKRPRFTSMASCRLHDEFGIEPANWKSGLYRFLESKN